MARDCEVMPGAMDYSEGSTDFPVALPGCPGKTAAHFHIEALTVRHVRRLCSGSLTVACSISEPS